MGIDHIKNKFGWSIYERVITAVVPNNDLANHITFEECCGCGPKWNGNCLVHNALDGRTRYEQSLD